MRTCIFRSEFLSAGVDISCDSCHICSSKEVPHWPAQTLCQQSTLDNTHISPTSWAAAADRRQQLYGHNSYFITFVFLSKFPPSNAQ